LTRGGARAFLLDIEGTTTPVSFVYDVLFPFARQRLAAFMLSPRGERHLPAVQAERARETEPRAPRFDENDPSPSAAAYLRWLMDRDRKSTALKAVQGEIWEDGFRAGALTGRVYPDVPPALARWTAAGRTVAIFSSGSVLAQKLLFGHSDQGDLTPHLAAYFDTTTGPKRDPESYRAIARALDTAPGDVVFVSDVREELDAAVAAGMETRLCVRPGAPETPAGGPHPLVRTFDEIDLGSS
jgi:enolase-phosphatase E1